jgi:hypothetical protein
MLKEFAKIFLLTGVNITWQRLLRRTLVRFVLCSAEANYLPYDPFLIKGKTSINPTTGTINVTAM